MTILQEILEWSQDRPAWQRDALRRLVVGGDLSDDDIGQLTDVCKSGYGLAEPKDIAPLTKDHVPVDMASSVPVSLLSIFHHRGVNALAEDQTLRFGPHLTVVYGDNGAGKTGYIRLLKSACRARSREQMLGNVISGTAPPTPVVSIKYKAGADEQPREWTGSGTDESVSRVSVFDTQSAAVYLTEKTDVAFRPFGLDLFDKLVQACRAVRTRLEDEQRSLASNPLISVQTQIPEGTAAARLLASISSLTKPETVRAITQLSSAEEARLALLEKSLIDLQTNDPEKLARQLDLRAGRAQGLALQLEEIEETLSVQAVTDVLALRTQEERKEKEAERLRQTTFSAGMLAGTGFERWAALWEAARRFSEEDAYRGEVFPVVEGGAHCVLCQQNIDDAASKRLKQFEAFVTSTTEKELRKIRLDLAQLGGRFTNLGVTTEGIDNVLAEIRIEHEALADSITAAVAVNENRRKAVVRALAENREPAADYPNLVCVADEVKAFAEQLKSRIKTLRANATAESRKPIAAEAAELKARKLLSKHEQLILDDIERRKKLAAYGICIEETSTQAITQKSTAVTKIAVSEKLKRSFKNELAGLNFRHVEVELREAGGAEGVLYHKLVLTRAPGVDLPKVVSEGEQRCLSIAAFFAELSTADDPSGIVFDDPISSLDYKWREGVALRLVKEARVRQVIVFTHDVVFLLLLKQFAEELGVAQTDQHVRHLSKGAGVCEEELPWVAMRVGRKIRYLKSEFQAADKLFREDHQDAYEREAKHIYGLLREAWERALEEVLLNGVVERYRPGVQTQQIDTISDIVPEDCRVLDAAMTKCSRWLTGHDQAAAARAPVPQPNELKSDIDTLESWVTAIRKRRQG